ncbi:hypothetical protein H106_05194 [Trichophyton rubrum CBS 735.88]|nr:hypothetical protein H106_05194 [Trichophyton rubrum CBS 735.88]
MSAASKTKQREKSREKRRGGGVHVRPRGPREETQRRQGVQPEAQQKHWPYRKYDRSGPGLPASMQTEEADGEDEEDDGVESQRPQTTVLAAGRGGSSALVGNEGKSRRPGRGAVEGFSRWLGVVEGDRSDMDSSRHLVNSRQRGCFFLWPWSFWPAASWARKTLKQQQQQQQQRTRDSPTVSQSYGAYWQSLEFLLTGEPGAVRSASHRLFRASCLPVCPWSSILSLARVAWLLRSGSGVTVAR